MFVDEMTTAFLLPLLMDALSQFVLIFDRQGHLLSASRSAMNLMPAGEDRIYSAQDLEAIWKMSVPALTQCVSASFEQTWDVRLLSPAGSPVYLRLRSYPIRKGKHQHASGVIIVGNEQGDQALIPRMAEETVHLVRNPLCAIKGAVHLARHEENLRDFLLSVIEEEVAGLEHAMDNLASLSGREYEVAAEVEMSGLLSRLAEDVWSEAVRRGVWLTFSTPRKRIVVRGNASRLSLAVTHLIRNAIEASPRQGTVHISLGQDGKKAVLDIVNASREHPLPLTEQMVAPFFSTRPGASGLGLPIACNIIRAHGGELKIKSRDATVTVTVSLPLLKRKKSSS